jgi:hypothetical protein
VVGFAEPSLVFILGGDQVKFTELAAALSHLAAGQSQALLIDSRQLPDLVTQMSVRRLMLVQKAKVYGFNYSNGTWTTLYLYQRV